MIDFQQRNASGDEFLTVNRPPLFFEGQLQIVEIPKNSSDVKHAALRQTSTAVDPPKLARNSAENS